MNNYRIKILLLSFLLGFSFLLVFSYIYISRIAVFNTINIETPNHDSEIIEVNAISPLNNIYHFDVNDKNILYKYVRPYRQIEIKLKYKQNVDVPIIVRIGDEYLNITLSGEQSTFILNKESYNLSTKTKIHLLLLMNSNHILLFILAISLISLIVLIIKNKSKILQLIKYIYNTSLQHPLIISAINTLIIILISFTLNQTKFSNIVELDKMPDQVEYHTCAVNYNNGYGFLIGGNIDKTTDYKLNFNYKNSDYKFNTYRGLKRLDRFPAYSFTLSLFYKIFGPNPIIIKYFQWIMLIIVVLFIPLITVKVWGNRTLAGGVFGAIIIYFYLLPYVKYLSPDIITFFLNFWIIYLHIKTRKNFIYKYTIPLALILGISFLFKVSLILYTPFLFLDLFLINRKKLKSSIIQLSLFTIIFLLIWLPYNIWSVNFFKKESEKLEEIFTLDYNSSDKLKTINELINNNNYLVLEDRLQINKDDLDYFNNEIKPNLSNTQLLNPQIMESLPREQQIISILYPISFVKSNYLMIALPPGNRLMDVNNEYVTIDGRPHVEWIYDTNNYYNTDTSEKQSDLARVIKFYTANPNYIFKIPLRKLQTYYANHIFTILLGLIISLYSLLFILKKKRITRTNIIKLVYIISFTLIIATSLILSTSLIYTIAFLVILLVIFDKDIRFIFTTPGLYISLSAFILPIVTSGNDRYLIYYDTYMIILIGIFSILFFNKTKELILQLKKT